MSREFFPTCTPPCRPGGRHPPSRRGAGEQGVSFLRASGICGGGPDEAGPSQHAGLHHSSRRGLTLLEVMIAVVILGASMGGLVALAGRALGVVRQAENYEVARRMLGRVDAEHPLWLEDEIAAGRTSGRFEGREAREGNWRWERIIEEVETTGESGADEKAGLYLLTTRVMWGQEGGRGGREEVTEYLFVPYVDGKRTLKPQGF